MRYLLSSIEDIDLRRSSADIDLRGNSECIELPGVLKHRSSRGAEDIDHRGRSVDIDLRGSSEDIDIPGVAEASILLERFSIQDAVGRIVTIVRCHYLERKRSCSIRRSACWLELPLLRTAGQPSHLRGSKAEGGESGIRLPIGACILYLGRSPWVVWVVWRTVGRLYSGPLSPPFAAAYFHV